MALGWHPCLGPTGTILESIFIVRRHSFRINSLTSLKKAQCLPARKGNGSYFQGSTFHFNHDQLEKWPKRDWKECTWLRYVWTQRIIMCLSCRGTGKYKKNARPVTPSRCESFQRDVTTSQNESRPDHCCAVGKKDKKTTSITHRIHVWYIYLHLVDFYGKCR